MNKYVIYRLKNPDSTIWRTKDKIMKIFNEEFKEKFCEFCNKPIPAAVISTVIATIICGTLQAFITIPKALTDAANNPEYIAKLSESVSNYNNINNSSVSNSSSQSNNDNHVTVNVIYGPQLEKYSDDFKESLGDILSVEANDISKSQTAYDKNEIIATDVDGKEYTAEDLVGKQITLKYFDEKDNKIVYFKGSYNENFHWDGLCLTNSYNQNGMFDGVCSSNFDDGIRKDYESFVVSSDNEWQYANKECTDAGNDGINITYSGNTSVEISYPNENEINVISVESIYDALRPNLHMTSYYKGMTIDEQYNDDTDQAYLLNFDENGRILLLYQGPFKKGFPNSNRTYDGWEIVYSRDDKLYYCNEGKFVNGHTLDQAISGISIEQIEEYLNMKNFDPDVNLSWIEE